MQENDPLFELVDAVGFSDYTRYYEKLRQIKEARLLSEKVDRMDSWRDESSSVCQKSTRRQEETAQIQMSNQETDESCKLNPSMNSKFLCARGKSILAMKKHFNLCQSKKSPISNPSTVRENTLPQPKSSFDCNLNTTLTSQSDVQQPIKDEPHFERMKDCLAAESKKTQFLTKTGSM